MSTTASTDLRTISTRKVVAYSFLLMFSLVYVYPFVVQIVTSFKPRATPWTTR